MEKLLDGGTFFEGPRWHAGAWWVSDFYSHRVLRIAHDGKAEEVATVENQPSGIGFLPDGDLLVVSMKDRRILRLQRNGTLKTHADLTAVTGGFTNDMVVDHQGRAYVGNFGFDIFGGAKPATATLVRVDPDGAVKIVADDLRCPNGSVIPADGKTLIVAESFAARLTAFTIDETGELSDRRVWATLGETPPWDSLESIGKATYAPDGCAIDAEDHMWVADAFNGRACRVAPGGKIVDEVQAPNGWGLYACALGGLNGRQLLLCIAPDYDDVKRKASPEAVLYTHEVTVPRGSGLP